MRTLMPQFARSRLPSGARAVHLATSVLLDRPEIPAPDQCLAVRSVAGAVELWLVERHPVGQLSDLCVRVVNGLGCSQRVDGSDELGLPRPIPVGVLDHPYTRTWRQRRRRPCGGQRASADVLDSRSVPLVLALVLLVDHAGIISQRQCVCVCVDMNDPDLIYRRPDIRYVTDVRQYSTRDRAENRVSSLAPWNLPFAWRSTARCSTSLRGGIDPASTITRGSEGRTPAMALARRRPTAEHQPRPTMRQRSVTSCHRSIPRRATSSRAAWHAAIRAAPIAWEAPRVINPCRALGSTRRRISWPRRVEAHYSDPDKACQVLIFPIGAPGGARTCDCSVESNRPAPRR